MDDLDRRHLGSGDLARLLGGELTETEIKGRVDHLLACADCRGRARDFSNREPLPKSLGRFKEVLKLADAEAQRLVANLLARAEWEKLRRMPKASQTDYLVLSRACHTREFLSLLFEIVKQPQSRSEAEMAARLAVLALKGADSFKWSSFERDRLTAQIWMELANSRRLAAEWDAADDALKRASPSAAKEKLLEARWLSISASLQSDRGFRPEALKSLERCRSLYEEENDWFSAGRSLIQMGHILVDHDPRLGLSILNRARPIVNPYDPVLRWLLEVTRTECLIETSQFFQALNAFRDAEEIKRFQPKPRAEIRSKFTSGRLLEALGYRAEAERLFEEVVAADMEHSLLKDGFMDLLYLFAFHLKLGEYGRAAALGRRTLGQLELLDSIHDQLKEVWRQLIDAAERKTLDLQLIPRVKEYIRIWWRRPGPGFTFVDDLGAKAISADDSLERSPQGLAEARRLSRLCGR